MIRRGSVPNCKSLLATFNWGMNKLVPPSHTSLPLRGDVFSETNRESRDTDDGFPTQLNHGNSVAFFLKKW